MNTFLCGGVWQACRAALLGLVFLTVPAGCITVQTLFPGEKNGPQVSQIGAYWQNRVLYSDDPYHSGAPNPVLAGRLYLFGKEPGHPLIEDGTVEIALFDDTAVASGGQSKALETWQLNTPVLKKLVRRDIVGQGYTLLLPWATFKPEITQIHLMLTFTPPKGQPIFAPVSNIALNSNGMGIAQISRRTVVPAALPQGMAAGASAPVLAGADSAQASAAHTRFIVPLPGTQGPAQQPPSSTSLNVQRLNQGNNAVSYQAP